MRDVYGTGYHASVKASVSPRTTVTVIGDGAVGLMAVLSAKRLGAERIILMGCFATSWPLRRSSISAARPRASTSPSRP